MDKIKAENLAEELIDKDFSDYKIVEYINCGKSAAVFKAEKEGVFYALKIFDNELVERFGHEIHQTRIEQELSLIGHNIENLVKIIDGGKTEISKNEYYYLIMEYIEGKNLLEFIREDDYDQEFILKALLTLYKICKSLISHDKPIVHRDIKPENIMVDSKRDIMLMDLGVLKFVGEKSISDADEKQFVGTLRYAPPEFLLREEEDTAEGWNAVNLYQIGGVLHDLTQKKLLFEEKTPYTKLVFAIKEDLPAIEQKEYSSQLIQLIRNMLSKDWSKRNELCSDQVLNSLNESTSNQKNALSSSIEELQSMSLDYISAFEEIASIQRTTQEKVELRKKISQQTRQTIINCLNYFKEKEIIKKLEFSNDFLLKGDKIKWNKIEISNHFLKLIGDFYIGFSSPLFLYVKIISNEHYQVEIHLTGFILSPSFGLQDFRNPRKLYAAILAKINTNSHPKLSSIQTIEIFNGVIDFIDTKAVEENLSIVVAKIIKLAKIHMRPEVEQYISDSRKMAIGETIKSGRSRIDHGITVFNTLPR